MVFGKNCAKSHEERRNAAECYEIERVNSLNIFEST
jgi:hypothetical protein